MAEAGVPGGRLPLDIYIAEGRRRGVLWTGIRLAVLGLVRDADGPVGAYELLARLRRDHERAHLTSVYRCLQRLGSAGLVVPILCWKRYLLSPDPRIHLWGVLLCEQCRQCMAIDLSSEFPLLERRAREASFSASGYSVECRGLCSRCADEGERA